MRHRFDEANASEEGPPMSDLPNGDNKPKNNGIRVPGSGFLPAGDNVKLALVEAGATTGQVDSVLWLLGYGREKRLGSVSALAKRFNVASSTLGRVFAGKYEAGLASIVSDIDHFRSVTAARAGFGERVICTGLRVVHDITDFCDLTRASQTIAILWGPNQSGKTWALEKIYTPANNHGRTIFVRMPVGGGQRLFLETLLKACGISERRSQNDMKGRILRYFDPQTLLIIDEFHQAMIGRSLRMNTIETVREIHDLTECGVVICGTDVLPDMIADPRFVKLLGQTDNRGVLRRRVPSTPYREDVLALCQAYGLGEPHGEARKLVDSIAGTNGIGKLCKYFMMARRKASKRKEPVAWDHFLDTHATLKSWERGEQMKRVGK